MNDDEVTGAKRRAALFAISGPCAIAAVALHSAGTVVRMAAPSPGAARALLELFSQKPLSGLIALDALSIPAALFIAVAFFGLHSILAERKGSLATLALIFVTLGLAAGLASNRAFDLLYLGKAFGNANFTAKLELEAAAAALLATMNGSASLASRLFGAAGLLLFAWEMRSFEERFGHFLPNLGLFAAVLTLVPPSAGQAGLFISWIALAAWGWFFIACALVFRRAAKMLE